MFYETTKQNRNPGAVRSRHQVVSRRIPELSITRLAMCTVAAVVTDGEKWLPGAFKQRSGLAGCEEMLCLVRVDRVQLRKTSRHVCLHRSLMMVT